MITDGIYSCSYSCSRARPVRRKAGVSTEILNIGACTRRVYWLRRPPSLYQARVVDAEMRQWRGRPSGELVMVVVACIWRMAA